MTSRAELDRYCNHVLTELGRLNPRLSQRITARMKRMDKQPRDKLKKKLVKIKMLLEEDRPLFAEIVAALNRAEWKGPRSPTNLFDLLERMLTELNYAGELTGGNYRADF